MNHEDRDHMTDRLLDAALARYSNAEPRNGLEQRILASVAAQRSPRAPIWNRLLWTASACAAALALVAGISLIHYRKPATNPPLARIAAPVHVEPRAIQVAVSKAAPVQTTRRPRIHATSVTTKEVSSPRRSQFPAPAPPTEQELLLIAYLNATPTHELLAVAADQQQWRERVRANSQVNEQTSAPAPEVNDLRNSPLESGTTITSAPSAR